jgi:penicillin-binding protein-related factor A (putative recombinase)
MGLGDLFKPPEKKKYLSYKENPDHPQKVGKRFQDNIKDVCDLYERLDLAYIQQFNLATIWVAGKEGGGYPIYKEKTGFDFIGGIASTKEAIFIECKSTEKGNIPVGDVRVGIKMHQLVRMDWLEKHGFLCFFLWEIRAGECVYKFTPSQIFQAIEGKLIQDGRNYLLESVKKSINILDMDNCKAKKLMKTEYKGQVFYDFLNYLE